MKASDTNGRRWVRRLTLRRADGRVYLDRWGFGHDRIGKILVHKMSAPDPGIDLHDHPWSFVSVILWGGYTELRANIRRAARRAQTAEESGAPALRGREVVRRPGSVKLLRLDECHTITELAGSTSWSLVICGPRRRAWGFYTPKGYMLESVYDATVRAARRDLWSEQAADRRPW